MSTKPKIKFFLNGDLTVVFIAFLEWIAWGSQGWILAAIFQDGGMKPWNSRNPPDELKGRPIDESRNNKVVGIAVIFSPLDFAVSSSLSTLFEYNRPFIEAFAPGHPSRIAVCPIQWIKVFDQPMILLDEYVTQDGFATMSDRDQHSMMGVLTRMVMEKPHVTLDELPPATFLKGTPVMTEQDFMKIIDHSEHALRVLRLDRFRNKWGHIHQFFPCDDSWFPGPKRKPVHFQSTLVIMSQDMCESKFEVVGHRPVRKPRNAYGWLMFMFNNENGERRRTEYRAYFKSTNVRKIPMFDANGVKIKLFSTSWMGTVVKDIRRCFALRGVHFTSTLEVEYDPLLEHMRAQRSANIIHAKKILEEECATGSMAPMVLSVLTTEDDGSQPRTSGRARHHRRRHAHIGRTAEVPPGSPQPFANASQPFVNSSQPFADALQPFANASQSCQTFHSRLQMPRNSVGMSLNLLQMTRDHLQMFLNLLQMPCNHLQIPLNLLQMPHNHLQTLYNLLWTPHNHLQMPSTPMQMVYK